MFCVYRILNQSGEPVECSLLQGKQMHTLKLRMNKVNLVLRPSSQNKGKRKPDNIHGQIIKPRYLNLAVLIRLQNKIKCTCDSLPSQQKMVNSEMELEAQTIP